MATFQQVGAHLKSFRKDPHQRSKTPLLEGNPHRRAVCVRVTIMSPKKPNSANRRIAKVKLFPRHLRHRRVNVHIPGIGHNLQKHGNVLLRGCRVRDLPGVHYRPIRGKMDLGGLIHRFQGRSKYGSKKF